MRSEHRTPFGEPASSARGEPAAPDPPDGVDSGGRLAASSLGRRISLAANAILPEMLRVVCGFVHRSRGDDVPHRRVDTQHVSFNLSAGALRGSG